MSELELRALNESLEKQVAARTRDRNRIWEVSRDLLGVANVQGVWLAINPAWTRCLGWRPEEIVNRTSEWMEHPDDVGKTRAEIRDLAAGQVMSDFENRFRTRNGVYRTLAWTATLEGGLLYCVAQDVTDERSQAAELAVAQDALRQSQKMEAVGQLTGGLAHDFNDLLAGISGSLELMQLRMQQGRLQDVERYVLAAQGGAKRAASLTHRLLAFARRQTLDPKPTDVNRLVRDVQDLIQRTVGPGIDVEVAEASGLWAALVDPSQLENSILNLCINARDAMPSGGRITIGADRAGRLEPAGQRHEVHA